MRKLVLVIALLAVPGVIALAAGTTVDSVPKETLDVAKGNFQLLHDALKGELESYKNVVWSTFGLILIAMGWLLTSKEARQFVRESAEARRVAMAAVVVIGVVHVFVLCAAAYKSQQILALLNADSYVRLVNMSAAYYSQSAIQWYFVPFSALLNGPMFVLLWFLLRSLGRPEKKH